MKFSTNWLSSSQMEFVLGHMPHVIYVALTVPPYGAVFAAGDTVGVLGCTVDELVSNSSYWVERIHPDDRQQIEATFRNPIVGEHKVCHYRFRREDGVYLWLRDEVNIIAVQEGKPPMVVGYCTDVTPLHREVRFRQALMQTAGEGICVCHATDEFPHVRFTEWNRRMTEMTGYGMDEINRQGWDETMYRGDGHDHHAHSCLGRACKGDQISGEEWTITTADGMQRVLLVSTSEAYADSGKRHVLAVMRDITGRKRAEQEREVVAQRIIAAQEGERRRIALDLHDQSAHGLVALQIALKQLDDSLPSRAKSARETLARCRELTTTITHQIRYLSQTLHPPSMGQISLSEALDGLCAESARASGLSVKYRGRKKLPPLPVNADLCLYRVLQEALTNVIRHSDAREVRVLLRADGEAVQLVAEDDGRGFDPTQSRAGLGLNGMRERMRLVGGTLEIETKTGKGTRLCARCPVGKRP